jgi:hypothetical protein
VIRQYNRVARDLTGTGPDLLKAARLMAMINVVGADMGMSVIHAKYHYLFWRPVIAIDPSAVVADGFGPVPGYDDGNPATVEQAGWRPLLTTPNHPEYPAAHGVVTSAMAEVFSSFLGTTRSTWTFTASTPPGRPGTSTRCGTSTRRTISATRSSTPGSGQGCTTTSQASPASSSAARSGNTTSGTPSDPSTRTQ